jgi:hypothetical protein
MSRPRTQLSPRRGIPAGIRRARRTGMAGIAYLEVLIATLLIMVALAPALEALAPGATGAGLHANRIEDHYAVASRMEELLAQPYAALDAAATAAGSRTVPASDSDTLTYADGRTVTRNVFLSRYDSDNADGDNNPFTGTEADLLWLRVAIGDTALETLLSAHD